MRLYLSVFWYFEFHWGMLLSPKNNSTKAAIKNNPRAPGTQDHQGDDSMWQVKHFRSPSPYKRKLSVLALRSVAFMVAFLFVPAELSCGGQAGQLSSVASWLLINFIPASVCWPLTSTVPRFTNPGRMSQPDLRDPCEGVLPEVQTQTTAEWNSMPGFFHGHCFFVCLFWPCPTRHVGS